MINKEMKHRMLRLDLLQSQSVNQYPNKIFYQYPDQVDWPRGFMFEIFRNQLVIEKDLKANILWFDNSFFNEIEYFYRLSGLAHDDEFVKNDLTTNFFQFNESIGNEEFNPSVFGNGMQIKIADEYARFFWDSLMEN
jgi:hypothetical protein